PGKLAHAGRSSRRRWEITVSGLLVRHPRGDLLIDAGNSTQFLREIKGQRFLPRQLLRLGPGSNRVVAAAPDALRALGEDPARLLGVAISHLHPDHAGGLVDLPGVPVLAAPEEIGFAAALRDKRAAQVVPAHADAILSRASPLVFKDGPYETFDESLD